MLPAEGSITLQIKVLPRSAQSEIIEISPEGIVKVKLRAVPEKGRANAELRGFLADFFGVPTTAVTILTGETSQRKLVKVSR
jgi:uncharacterized protein (TIGR00251 family)